MAAAPAAVFILDEPTRGIDVGAKFEIYKIINQLAADGDGHLFISSEIEELIGMCDRILVMSHGEIRGFVDRAVFDREEILKAAMRDGLSWECGREGCRPSPPAGAAERAGAPVPRARGGLRQPRRPASSRR